MNNFRNKIVAMAVILQDLQLNYFVLSETKLGKSSPTSQFYISRYVCMYVTFIVGVYKSTFFKISK